MQKPTCSPIRSGPSAPGHLLLAGSLLLLGALGCQGDSVSHYRVPKEAAPAPSPAMAQVPGTMPPQAGQGAPTPQFAGTPLKWTLPTGWSETAGEGMRFATFKTPLQGRVEATVVVLPGPAGGELANVNRWRGQISLPPLDEAALAKARATLKTRAGVVNVYDFTSEGKAQSRMVAGYISAPDGNTWFLKLTGDAAPVAKGKPDFMRILESLRLD